MEQSRNTSLVPGWSQVDKNDLDHIVQYVKLGVITRFADLNSRAHSGKNTGSFESFAAVSYWPTETD